MPFQLLMVQFSDTNYIHDIVQPSLSISKTLKINLFIYWLHWVFVAAHRLSLVAASGGGATLHCGAWASHCSGFSCCGAWALGMQASVVVAHRL